MNIKMLLNCILLSVIYTNHITSSHKEESFDIIEKTEFYDQIFALIQDGNPEKLHEYLNANPEAINARTPHEDDGIRVWSSAYGKRPGTIIIDGKLPLHTAIELKDIACMQVLVDHLKTTQSTQDDIAAYQAKIDRSLITSEKLATKIASFIESEKVPKDYTITKHGMSICHTKPQQFASLALSCLNHQDTAHNAIFNEILAVSTQAEKDESLYDGWMLLFNNNYTKDRTQYEHWINKLVQAGTDINYKNGCRHTILHEVATHDIALPGMTADLIKKYGANIHEVYGEDDNTIIHEAVEQGSWTTSKQLAIGVIVGHGLSIEAKNKYNQTPAHVAFKHGRIYAGWILANNFKADLTSKDTFEKTPFDYYQDNKLKYNNCRSRLYDCEDLDNEDFSNGKVAERATKLEQAIIKIHNNQLSAKR